MGELTTLPQASWLDFFGRRRRGKGGGEEKCEGKWRKREARKWKGQRAGEGKGKRGGKGGILCSCDISLRKP